MGTGMWPLDSGMSDSGTCGLGDMDTRTWELGEVGTWGLGCDKQKTNDVFAECVKSYD